MTARFFDLDALGHTLQDESRMRADTLRNRGIVPCLVLVEVGEDPQSALYVSRKIEDCEKTGIAVRRIVLPHSVTGTELLAQIRMLNADASVSSVLVQLPLPAHLDDSAILQAISPHKDVDGLHPFNLLALSSASPNVIPCTVRGIDALLALSETPLQGARLAIVGRGKLVGLPAALLFAGQSRNTTVTILNRNSKNLGSILKEADIVIAAAGSAHLIRPDMIRAGAVVIDVGMSWPEGTLQGDVHPDVAQIAGWMTPPDQSFGIMTRMMLLKTVLDIAEKGLPA